MKRACSLSWLLERSNRWLPWWQELTLNWVASWRSVGTLVVCSADGQEECHWSLPSDVDMQRAELEQLLER